MDMYSPAGLDVVTVGLGSFVVCFVVVVVVPGFKVVVLGVVVVLGIVVCIVCVVVGCVFLLVVWLIAGVVV